MAFRIVAAVIVIALAALGATRCGTMETGNVGVRNTLGKINPDEVEPGSIAELYVKYAARHAKADGNREFLPAYQIINQSLTREYPQHESNLALMTFAEKVGAATVVIPANMQTAPLISINAAR